MIDPCVDADIEEAAHIYCLAHDFNDPIMTTIRKIALRLRARQLNPPPSGDETTDPAALPVVASAPQHPPGHAGRD